MPRADLAYPQAAEAFWLERVAESVGPGTEGLERLAVEVARLSDIFTKERPAGAYPDYFSDPCALAAYGVFFLPQGWVRAGCALDQCMRFRGWRPAALAPRVLDVGCGPGSCGISAARSLVMAGFRPSELIGIDHSPAALTAFEALAAGVLDRKIEVKTRLSDARSPEAWPTGSFDLIIAGFVLNELDQKDAYGAQAWMEAACARLAPGGLLLVLEPALRFAAERLLKASDGLAATGRFFRLGPQLDALPSPLPASGRDHWEHESCVWTAPDSAQFVNRKLHRDLREVRFSYAAFLHGTPAVELPAGSARIVSDIQTIKGLVRFIVVAQGREQQVEVATRGMSKHEVKLFAARLARGCVVVICHSAASKVRLSGPGELAVLWGP
jgi:SAM-dependent methyltransferase